jgi:hypothetical protein
VSFWRALSSWVAAEILVRSGFFATRAALFFASFAMS